MVCPVTSEKEGREFHVAKAEIVTICLIEWASLGPAAP